MQKTKVNFDTVYEFETLYNAYRASRRGKRWKNTVAKVEMNALEAIAVLQEELSTGTYRPGGYREFYVFEPKKRLIQTNSFKDKIVQHAFCDTILYDVLTRPFILDNYGSQIGKGTHFGLNRLRDFMREYYRRHGSADGWVLKADVHHYFASIRHDILKQDVRELLDDERSLALTDLIIDSTPGNVGIPIGNQSSQVFALLYLNKLDHLMKEGFRFRYYGRYMDDFYIIHESKDTLRAAQLSHGHRKGRPQAAPGQPRADETETAEVQGHVRERSHHQGENHRELPELAVTRFPRRLPRAHTEIRPTLQ